MAFVSVSHHVRNRSQADVVARLSASKTEGFVFPRSVSGWVTVVAESDRLTTGNECVKGLEHETALHYWYAKDVLWGFGVASAGKLVMNHSCDWSQRPKVVVFSSAEAKALAKICRAQLAERELMELTRLLGLNTVEAVMEYEPYFKVPKMLGLDHYENMSFHMLDRDPERSLNRYTGLRWVAVQ